MKVFSELRDEKRLFAERYWPNVRNLLVRDLSVSPFGIPTNCFAFECWLLLVQAGDDEAADAVKRLLTNREFLRRDHFDFNIIANIVRFCGDNSLLTEHAVNTFLSSPDWQAVASNYTQDAVRKFVAAHPSPQQLPIEIRLASTDSNTREIAFNELTKIAETDFQRYVSIILAVKDERALSDAYRDYIESNTPFSTQHGVKGAQFDRVLVVLDDEESAYRQYSYGKYFGYVPLSDADRGNIANRDDSVVDRTRRLFYVCCSRAMKDLAVVLFAPDVAAARAAVIHKGLFLERNIYDENAIHLGRAG